jgi:hypothetical protein
MKALLNMVKVTITKLIVPCSLLVALLVFLPLSLQAKVTGVCSSCHTMHNSQNGQAMAKDDSGNLTFTPYGVLLIYSCVGCHSAANAITWQDGITKAPVVFNTGEPNYGNNGLAAGNFYYVGANDLYGHNVFTTNSDGTLGNTPPGAPDDTALTAQLRCAGTWGCHGHNGRQSGDTAVDDQTIAMKGAHHGDDIPPLEGSLADVARNYRFLLGIKGKEDTDWEKDNVNTSHNEYKGAIGFTDTTTISYLCGECHGNFHSADLGSTTPWRMHPTDVVLKNSVGAEYSAYTNYSMVAPVARPEDNYTGNADVVRPGTDIIMCLSCHRAHASPYYKMMRWDYKGWPANLQTNGCNVCHTSKN